MRDPFKSDHTTEKREDVTRKITKKQTRDAQRTSWLATVLGYNELAKSAPTLGEKVYYRLALGHARDKYIELGGKLKMTQDEGDFVLVLDGKTRPHINFKAKDIELMRQTVADYDAANVVPCVTPEKTK